MSNISIGIFGKIMC